MYSDNKYMESIQKIFYSNNFFFHKLFHSGKNFLSIESTFSFEIHRITLLAHLVTFGYLSGNIIVEEKTFSNFVFQREVKIDARVQSSIVLPTLLGTQWALPLGPP